jgi:hypothetical protein
VFIGWRVQEATAADFSEACGGVMAEEVTLEFIARQQQQLLGELRLMQADIRDIRDDIRVLRAMAVRQDNRSQPTSLF